MIPAGCWVIATAYELLYATLVGIVNDVAPAGIATMSAPFDNTNPAPLRPMIVPPRSYACAEQVTTTFATLADMMLPLPPATEQVCPVGCVATVTVYCSPDERFDDRLIMNAPLSTPTVLPFTFSVSPSLLSPLTVALRVWVCPGVLPLPPSLQPVSAISTRNTLR